MGEITELLDASRRGDDSAVHRLYALLYDDLHDLAHARLRRGGSITLLDTTALVHESYLRLCATRRIEAQDRGRFMAYAAKIMRSIVVDFVRRRRAERRGGDVVHIEVSDDVSTDSRECEVLQIHEALAELAAIDERLVQVVEMRYFAGLTEQEVAQALDRSVRSIARDWEKAKLYLAANLG